MPRKRVIVPGVPVHVIRRGINRSNIFGDAMDFEYFLRLLEWSAGHQSVSVHSFVLMDTHYHLIATPDHSDGLSLMMRDLNREYARRFNRRYDRIGTLWTGCFRDIPVEDARYFLTCMRYVELNPVRAKMVAAAQDYRWSSYRVHAFGESSEWLVPHSLYLALGKTPADRQNAYRALSEQPVTEADLVRERTRLRKHSRLSPQTAPGTSGEPADMTAA